jgi:hypothetical protein
MILVFCQYGMIHLVLNQLSQSHPICLPLGLNKPTSQMGIFLLNDPILLYIDMVVGKKINVVSAWESQASLRSWGNTSS